MLEVVRTSGENTGTRRLRMLECWSADGGISTVEELLKFNLFLSQIFFLKK